MNSPNPVHVIGANGHFHSRGTRFDIYSWDGVTPTTLTNSIAQSQSVVDHSITLTGLQPDTVYYYRVTSTDVAPAANATTEPAGAPASFMFSTLHLGDTMFHGYWWRMALWHGPFDVVLVPVCDGHGRNVFWFQRSRMHVPVVAIPASAAATADEDVVWLTMVEMTMEIAERTNTNRT